MASFPLHLRDLFADNEIVVVEDNCRTHAVSNPLGFATLAAVAPQQKSDYFRRRCRWESAPAVTTASYRLGISDRAPVLKRRIDPSLAGKYSFYNVIKPMARCPPPSEASLLISNNSLATAIVGVETLPEVNTRQSNLQENLDQVLMFSQALGIHDDL